MQLDCKRNRACGFPLRPVGNLRRADCGPGRFITCNSIAMERCVPGERCAPSGACPQERKEGTMRYESWLARIGRAVPFLLLGACSAVDDGSGFDTPGAAELALDQNG